MLIVGLLSFCDEICRQKKLSYLERVGQLQRDLKQKVAFLDLFLTKKDFMDTTSEKSGFFISGIIPVIIFMICLYSI